MQPVQLSLIPEPSPRPAVAPAVQLPEQVIALAIPLLAGVIAKAALPQERETAGDE